jgi:hypothetical protein
MAPPDTAQETRAGRTSRAPLLPPPRGGGCIRLAAPPRETRGACTALPRKRQAMCLARGVCFGRACGASTSVAPRETLVPLSPPSHLAAAAQLSTRSARPTEASSESLAPPTSSPRPRRPPAQLSRAGRARRAHSPSHCAPRSAPRGETMAQAPPVPAAACRRVAFADRGQIM